MSQSLTTLVADAFMNFTANVVRYIMIQKNFIKMSRWKKKPDPRQPDNPNQELKARGKLRKVAAENRALYYSNLGMLFTEVCDKIEEEFGYKKGSSFVEKIVGDARKLVKQNQELYAEGIAKRNIARLEKIIQDALNEGNRALALKAMDLLAKTGNVYNTNIKIENEENKSFEIKLKSNDN